MVGGPDIGYDTTALLRGSGQHRQAADTCGSVGRTLGGIALSAVVVAKDPTRIPTRDQDTGMWHVIGSYDGIDVAAQLRPTGEIAMGYPLHGPGVHVNDSSGTPQTPLSGDHRAPIARPAPPKRPPNPRS